MEYIAYLHKDKGSDFGVSFADFPGCVTAGRTLEEARTMAVEALALHMAGMTEDGEALPEPSTLDQLAGDPAMQGAVAFLVSAEVPEKTVRVNITARESQIEAIDKLARKAGMTRSAYMVQSAVRGGTGRDRWGGGRSAVGHRAILAADRRCGMASSVALSEAQEHLAELLIRAEGGEEILIEREGRPAMKIVPVAAETATAGKRIFGQNLLGITYIAPDFDDPMSEEELKEWGM